MENTFCPAYAEKILTEGDVDFVAMGRSWLADPQWGEKAISGRDEDIRKCLGCMYCFETAGNNLISGGSHAFCSVNPCMGEEASCDDSVADGEGRSVVVVGGGPAGLEASRRDWAVRCISPPCLRTGQRWATLSSMPKNS